MKLYVWDNVLTDYTSGVMFALAESAEEARDLICPGWNEAERIVREKGVSRNSHPGGYRCGVLHMDLLGEPEVYESPVGFSVWGGG